MTTDDMLHALGALALLDALGTLTLLHVLDSPPKSRETP